MTLKLYYAPGACSFVPHAMLEIAGATFEPLAIKLHKNEQNSPEYLALNARGQVPVLVDGGEAITQLMALVAYIDARFPEAGFVPRDALARARFVEALAWMNNTVHPTFTHIVMPQKFSDNAAVQEELRRYNTGLYRAMLGELQGLVQRALSAGQPWLGGAQFGPLDAYSLTLTRWGGLAGINPLDFPELWAFVQRVASHPAAARAIERERLQLNLYKPA